MNRPDIFSVTVAVITQAMHKKFVGHVVSRIILIVSFLLTLPLAWAWHDDPHSTETAAFIVTILVGILVSGIFVWRFPIRNFDFRRVHAKDALAIVGLSWIFLSLLGALPLYLSHATTNFTDAFFEVASGFTTTGATIFTDIEALPRGILFWRSLTHWLGGMGIIVLYLALLPALGQNAFQLYKAEAPGLVVERIQPRIKETAKLLWEVYVLLSVVETLLLLNGGMSLFDALCHTFGTMATGGFSTKNASVAAFSPQTQWTITIFMFLAGTNFILHALALQGRPMAYFRSEEFRNYAMLILALIPVFAVTLSKTVLTASPWRDSVFQIVSIVTTTGYTTANFGHWPYVLQFFLLVLMFIGGCGGSTGGGMKVIRTFLIVKVAVKSVIKTVLPNAVLPIKFENTPLSERLVQGAMAYFVMYVLMLLFGAFVLTATDSCDLITAMSASLASLSNIGPGLARVGAVENYGWVSVPGKWVLTFLMLAGRLELYAVLILFSPMTWRK